MTQSSNTLQDILTKCTELSANGSRILSVYDLDSTLFDVQPRHERILKDFAELPEIQAMPVEHLEILKQVQMQAGDWGIREAVERARLHEIAPQMVKRLRGFWADKFFSNPYLRYDEPIAGAVEFVKHLQNLGAEHIYLTGRNEDSMWRGSVDVLNEWGFPLSHDARELVMKDNPEVPDDIFKQEWFRKLPQNEYGLVLFFENEPINLEKAREAHPELMLVFFDSVHSGRRPPLEGVPAIKDFRF